MIAVINYFLCWLAESDICAYVRMIRAKVSRSDFCNGRTKACCSYGFYRVTAVAVDMESETNNAICCSKFKDEWVDVFEGIKGASFVDICSLIRQQM